MADIVEAKVCTVCGETRPLTDYWLQERGVFGRHSHCKYCRAAYRREYARDYPQIAREQQRKTKMKQNYGLTPEAYEAMLAGQGGGCAICGFPPPEDRRLFLDIDHDHETGAVRGLLCNRCNTMLGQSRDNPERLEAGAEYLRRQRGEYDG